MQKQPPKKTKIKIKCTCGTKLKASDSVAGKRVTCSVCKKMLYVPRIENPEKTLLASEDASGWIRVKCACGQVIKAPMEWAGKTGTCPRCGADVVMPKPERTF